MSENLRLYTTALFGFDHVVRLAPADGWSRPSPCTGWTARHVLGHVNAIQRYIEATIAGREPTMNPMVRPDRHAGDDPITTWRETRDTLLEVLDHPDVLQRVVASFWGLVSVDQMIGFNVGDTTVHSWDLARALGVDERLEPSLVDRSLELFTPIAAQLVMSGAVGPPVVAGAGADAQSRLLGLVGRRP